MKWIGGEDGLKSEEEVQINYDAIKKLHDHAELLKREMQTIMNHSYRQKIKAQAMVLYHVCDTIATYTMSRSKAISILPQFNVGAWCKVVDKSRFLCGLGNDYSSDGITPAVRYVAIGI